MKISSRQINHLIQFDEKPNLEIQEPRWEIYKISISFSNAEFLAANPLFGGDLSKLKGSNHRVFFQNAEGNINMGVLFNDPDIELDEILWFYNLASEITYSIRLSFKSML